jgi:hypothetical protein
MSNTPIWRRFLVREGLKDFMVWDRNIHGPAMVDGQPIIGFSKEQANKIRDVLNEPAMAGDVKPRMLDLADHTSTASLAPPHTKTKVRSGLAREDDTQFADPSTAAPPGAPPPSAEPWNYVEHGIEKFGVRPGCPKCNMNMIVLNTVSIVPGKKTYECLRCGHVSEPGDPALRTPRP